jgi:hypothetical protein
MPPSPHRPEPDITVTAEDIAVLVNGLDTLHAIRAAVALNKPFRRKWPMAAKGITTAVGTIRTWINRCLPGELPKTPGIPVADSGNGAAIPTPPEVSR